MSIDRLNYFKGEVLHAEDFQCEQNYHLEMRRRHNKYLHSPGIVYGLEIVAGTGEVTIKPGMAIDKNGKEIVVDVAQKLTIASATDLGIKYKETADPASDNTDTTFPGKKRTQEGFEFTFSDADAILLAKINPALSPVGVDQSLRSYSSPVSNGNLDIGGDLTVQGNLTVEGSTTIVNTEVMKGNVELGDSNTDTVKVMGVLKTGHTSGSLKIESPVTINGAAVATSFQTSGDITVSGKVDGRDVSNDGTNLDSHLANTSNPHGTTAAQIDGSTNKIVAQINLGSGVINEKQIDPLIAREARFNVTTGHDHDGVDSKKIPGISSTYFADLSGASLTGLNGSQITSGTVAEARIDPLIARDSRFHVTTGHDHDGVDSKKIPGISSTYFADLSGASLTGLNGSQITSGTVADARIDANIFRAANYGFKNGISSHQFTFTNANVSGAIRTVATTFLPKFIWAVSSVRAMLGAYWHGASVSTFVDLSRTPFLQQCSYPIMTRYAVAPFLLQDAAITENYCSYAIFKDLTGTVLKEITIGAAVSSATATSLVITFFRKGPTIGTGVPPQEIANFQLNINILCFG